MNNVGRKTERAPNLRGIVMNLPLLIASVLIPLIIAGAPVAAWYFTNERDFVKLAVIATVPIGAGIWLMFFLTNLLGLTLCVLGGAASIIGAALLLTTGRKVLVVAAIVMILGSILWSEQFVKKFVNDHTVTCTVTGKDRGGNKGSYRVYTSCGTFANRDSVIQGKTNSADVQGQIPEKGVVTLHVAGARVSLWSWMPNILEVKSGK